MKSCLLCITFRYLSPFRIWYIVLLLHLGWFMGWVNEQTSSFISKKCAEEDASWSSASREALLYLYLIQTMRFGLDLGCFYNGMKVCWLWESVNMLLLDRILCCWLQRWIVIACIPDTYCLSVPFLLKHCPWGSVCFDPALSLYWHS